MVNVQIRARTSIVKLLDLRFLGKVPAGTQDGNEQRLELAGNATFRHHNSALLSVSSVEAPMIVSSTEFDRRLASTLQRL